MFPQLVSPREGWHSNALPVVVIVCRSVVTEVKYSVVVRVFGIVLVQVKIVVAT
jgi:hypothetical protein